METITRKKLVRNISEPLQKYYSEKEDIIEIGIDEAGRGPLFGRVYTAAVILPKDDSFDHTLMKDSKKFHSKKKINEVAEYIKKNATKWSVAYTDEKTIDRINIRQATLQTMHKSINNIIDKEESNKYHLIVDGNDFRPYMVFHNDNYYQIRHTCIENGDNKYTAIAAASILAKVERDKYINQLCEEHTYLHDKYDLNNNKGYGTQKHIDAIKENGISQWHRKTYGICKNYS